MLPPIFQKCEVKSPLVLLNVQILLGEFTHVIRRHAGRDGAETVVTDTRIPFNVCILLIHCDVEQVLLGHGGRYIGEVKCVTVIHSREHFIRINNEIRCRQTLQVKINKYCVILNHLGQSRQNFIFAGEHKYNLKFYEKVHQ